MDAKPVGASSVAEAEVATRERQQTLAYLMVDTEQRLDLPPGFVVDLLRTGSDWEFIIKLAVLAEAAVTQALVSCLHNELLFDHLSGQRQSARLQLCGKLGVLSKQEQSILEALAQIRNQFAHRVENLSRTLVDYFVSLPVANQVRLANTLLMYEGDDRYKECDDLSLFVQTFRESLHTATVISLSVLSTKRLTAEAERMRHLWLEQQVEGRRQDLARFNGLRSLSDLVAVGKNDTAA